LAQYRETLGAVATRFTQFFSSQTAPMRLISRSRPFSLAPRRLALQQRTHPLDDVRDMLLLQERVAAGEAQAEELARLIARRQEPLARALRQAPGAEELLARLAAGEANPFEQARLAELASRVIWRWRWLKSDRRALEVIESIAPPMALDHYVIVWPETFTDPQALRGTLRASFLLPEVTPGPLPALFAGRYVDEGDHLAPEEEGRPFLAVLTADDIRGEWSLYGFHDLLMGEFNLALSIDIETIERSKARGKVTDAATVLHEAVYGKNAARDARSQAALASAEYALKVLQQQNLHNVAYAVLVQAPTRSALDRQVEAVRGVLGGRLALDRIVGCQAELIKLFTTTPAAQIQAPILRRNTLSQSVAVKIPWGYRKSSRTDGIEWGYDPHEGMPIYWNPWGSHGFGNAHLMMIGQPGSGKTVALLTLARRLATRGQQVIFFDPLGKCNWLCDAAQGGGRYYQVDTEAAVNILDVASDDLRRQRDQVLRRLSILLGRIILRGEDVAFEPRAMSNFEIGALDRALEDRRVYGPAGSALPLIDPARPPLLEDLVEALRGVAEREGIVRIAEAASLLADEITASLLGSSAKLFNAPTQLEWHFDADVVGYDFGGADKSLLPLYYDVGFEALNAWVRSPERKQRWPQMVAIIDEFKFMASVKELEARVAMATKVWRNHGAGMWSADQNAATYFGQAGLPSEWGPFVAENVAVKLLGRQEGDGAEILARVYGHQLSPADIDSIRTSTSGQFIAILGDEIHRLAVQLTDLESAYFLR
jgi:hypothetical protein